jgi:hypothetical protein
VPHFDLAIYELQPRYHTRHLSITLINMPTKAVAIFTQAEAAQEVGLTPNALAVLRHRNADCPGPSSQIYGRPAWTKKDVDRLRSWLDQRYAREESSG